MMRQDFNTGEEQPVSFKGDTGKNINGYFLTLQDEEGQLQHAQAWVIEGGELYKDGEVVEGDITGKEDQQGNTKYTFRKTKSGGGSFRKGSYQRDHKKDTIASAATMAESYAKDLVVALISQGKVKDLADVMEKMDSLSNASYARSVARVGKDIDSTPQVEEESEKKTAEKPAQAAAPAKTQTTIDPEDEIDISDIPF